MKTYLIERPSALAAACAQVPTTLVAHDAVMGRPAVPGAAVVLRPESVPSNVKLLKPIATDQRISGFAAKVTGMTVAPNGGVKVSGVPPRGRPV